MKGLRSVIVHRRIHQLPDPCVYACSSCLELRPPIYFLQSYFRLWLLEAISLFLSPPPPFPSHKFFLTAVAGGAAQATPLLLLCSQVKLASGARIGLQAVRLQLERFKEEIPVVPTLALEDPGTVQLERRKGREMLRLSYFFLCAGPEETGEKTCIEQSKGKAQASRACPCPVMLANSFGGGWANIPPGPSATWLCQLCPSSAWKHQGQTPHVHTHPCLPLYPQTAASSPTPAGPCLLPNCAADMKMYQPRAQSHIPLL